MPVAELFPEEVAAFDPLAAWRGLYERIARRLFPHLRPDARAATTAHFEAFFGQASRWRIKPSLIHGDFGTGNIICDSTTGQMAGVVDFGSAGVGDPAVDFAALPWTPPAFFDGLLAAYPAIASAPERVAFYRGTFALQEALFGVEEGDKEAFRRGIEPFSSRERIT